jgi:ribose transport system ATP-binding protein
MNADIVSLDRIGKRFGGVTALDDVSLGIAAGEVHGVVGCNGAGKSSLMNLLAGVEQPDTGRILLRGQPIELKGPVDARRRGISTVFQELQLFPHRSVMENLFVNRELVDRGATLRRSAMRAASTRALSRVGLAVAPETRVGTLSLGERQRVEIARALDGQSDLVIFDEPNSALSDDETARLFELIRHLKKQGVTSVYVSQRLEDVFEIADRITVLRDGRQVGTFVTGETTMSHVIAAMIGRPAEQTFPVRQAPSPDAPVLLLAEGLTHFPTLSPIDLRLRAGEIVGVAGLEGSGVRDLFHLLFGLQTPTGGRIVCRGRQLRHGEPQDAIRAGMAMIPASRRDDGLMLDWTVRRNAMLLILDQLCDRAGFIDRDAVEASTCELIRRMAVVAPGPDALAFQLSGGNQQKLLLGKWLATRPRILLLDDPTRGVDIGAKREIYRLCDQLAREGAAILFSSSELDETVGLCDRTLVMSRGRMVREFARAETSKPVLLRAMVDATSKVREPS